MQRERGSGRGRWRMRGRGIRKGGKRGREEREGRDGREGQGQEQGQVKLDPQELLQYNRYGKMNVVEVK